MSFVKDLSSLVQSYDFIDMEGLEKLRQDQFKLPVITFYGSILKGIAQGHFEPRMGEDFDLEMQDIHEDEIFEDEVYLVI
jgi:hypothetical protein